MTCALMHNFRMQGNDIHSLNSCLECTYATVGMTERKCSCTDLWLKQ